MAQWDVFHSDRLELERSIDTAGVIERLGRGALTGDDLIRPAGSSEPWSRIGDRPALLEAAAAPAPVAPPSRKPEPKPEPEPEPAPEPEPPKSSALPPDLAAAPTLIGHEAGFPIDFDDLGDDEEVRFPSDPEVAAGRPAPPGDSYGEYDLKLRSGPPTLGPERSSVEVAVVAGDEDDDVFHGDGEPDLEEYDPLEEDEAVAEFTLSRGRAETVEELDLAAMVDVAFQLVLFFLVTATTVLYKTLEVPKPNPDANPPASAAQGRSRSLDDLKEDFILVEVDPGGSIKVDREPVPPDREALVARLREARERTNRQGLLLSADFTTPHRNAVLVYDAANEARLNIAIARPSRSESP